MSWTDERVELLKKLWMEGLSASQIAAQLGSVTRNAVIGKVHRLGLSGRAKSSSSAARPKRQPRATNYGSRSGRNGHRAGSSHPSMMPSTGYRQAAAQPEAIEAPEPLKLDLIQLSEQTCKWPIGDPAEEDFHFCGHKVKEASPYCAYHSQLAYQPVVDRRRDRRAARA